MVAVLIPLSDCSCMHNYVNHSGTSALPPISAQFVGVLEVGYGGLYSLVPSPSAPPSEIFEFHSAIDPNIF